MGAPKPAKKKKGPTKIAAPRPDGKAAAAPMYARMMPDVAAKLLPQITSPLHGSTVNGTVTFTLTTNQIGQNHFLVILDPNGNIYDPPGKIPVDFSGGSPVFLDVDFTGIPNGTAYSFRLVAESPTGRTSHEIDVTVG